MAGPLQEFFSSETQTVHSGGVAQSPLKRPGLRVRLAVLGAALALFAGTAVFTPAMAQDARGEKPAIEEIAQSPVTVTNPDRFEADVVEASKDQALLLYIYAPGCDYCERYGPVLEIEAELAGDVKLVKLNIDDYPEFTWEKFKDMQGVPYVGVYAHGLFIDKSAGAPPEGREFDAAQAVVNYASNVYKIVGEQLKSPAPDTPATTPKTQKPAP